MKMKGFIALLGLMLIVATIFVGNASAQGTLILKGEILEDYRADIYLHAMNETTGEWDEVSSKADQVRYRFKLNTNIVYRIMFMGNAGGYKTVNVAKGEVGKYREWLDIDFDEKEDITARMYLKNGLYKLSHRLEFEYADIDE